MDVCGVDWRVHKLEFFEADPTRWIQRYELLRLEFSIACTYRAEAISTECAVKRR